MFFLTGTLLSIVVYFDVIDFAVSVDSNTTTPFPTYQTPSTIEDGKKVTRLGSKCLKNKNGQVCMQDTDCCSTYCDRSFAESISGVKDKRCVSCRTGHDCPEGKSCVNYGSTQADCEGDGPKTIPGIDRILRGYNIFKSDPLRPGSKDAGWSRPGYLKHEYDVSHGASFTLGEKYDVPKAFHVTEVYDCSAAFHTETLTTSESIIKEISKSVTVSGEAPIPNTGATVGGGIGVGSSSKWQQDVSQSKTTSISRNRCDKYEVFLRDNKFPALTSQFKEWLDDNFDGSDGSYMRTFDKVGTHIVSEAIFGSMLGVTSSFSSSERETLEEESSSLKTSLSIGVEGVFSFGKTDETQERKKIQTTFRKMESSWNSFTVGSSRISSVEEWEKDSMTSPDVLQMKLVSICDVLEYHLGNDNVNKVQCKRQYTPYCEEHLGLGEQCHFVDKVNCVYNGDGCSSRSFSDEYNYCLKQFDFVLDDRKSDFACDDGHCKYKTSDENLIAIIKRMCVKSVSCSSTDLFHWVSVLLESTRFYLDFCFDYNGVDLTRKKKD